MNLRHIVVIISVIAMLLSPCALRSQSFRISRDLDANPPPAEPQVRFPTLFGPRRVAVMLIGDSLSFGPFGEKLELLLKKETRNRGVCVFASCGSSPENWVDGQSVYITKCGYRQLTPNPRETYFNDFEHGKRPPPTATPKLGRILSNYRPDVIIIQQGTNWMDGFNPSRPDDYKRIGCFIRAMISEIKSRSPNSRIVWVLPPSAAKYSSTTQTQISDYIRRCGQA